MPNRIYLDFDFRRTPRSMGMYGLFHTLKIKVNWYLDERSRRGWHRIIDTDYEFSPAEAVAVESMLGSDRARCRINLLRAMSLRENPDAFWYERFDILYREKIK